MEPIYWLPCEIIHAIARCLDAYDVGKWSLTCRTMFRFLNQDDAIWKYLYHRKIIGILFFRIDLVLTEIEWNKWDKTYTYKEKVDTIFRPYTIGVPPYYPKSSPNVSQFYDLLKYATYLTRPSSLRVYVLTVAGRKYVFLGQIRRSVFNRKRTKVIYITLFLFNPEENLVAIKGYWLHQWTDLNNKRLDPQFSATEIPKDWKVPSKPYNKPVKHLHQSYPPNTSLKQANIFFDSGNYLIDHGFASIRQLNVPVYKLRLSTIRISQNYRFLVTQDDYDEVFDYVGEILSLLKSSEESLKEFL